MSEKEEVEVEAQEEKKVKTRGDPVVTIFNE